mgnify:FL=1
MNDLRGLIYLLGILLTPLLADPLDVYWQQKVDYEMEITLHDSIQQLTGTTIIKYTNNSPDSLDRLYIHLYPNAFQNGSVKSREYIGNSGRSNRAKYFKDRLDDFSSKIDIHDLSILAPKKGESWIHKDVILDEWDIDDTILEASLLKKLGPGQTVRIDMNWTHHIGDMVERAGYFEGQYNMAQWYPKMAVYDENGWHADVFHAEGEFYGEFGDFRVKFDLPESFIIAASGIVTEGDPGWESVTVDTSFSFDVWVDIFDSTHVKPDSSSRRSVTFFAENVHDFAWVASKDFLYEGGKSSDGETDVHVLYDKERGSDWTKDVLERSIRAIDWLEEKFGDYPYPQITTTDRVKSGGMEYPMLVMNGRDDEGLIVHEYGHIYFYGILANNELDEAWMDEGFTTTQTTQYMIDRYGGHGFEIELYENHKKFPNKYYQLQKTLDSDQWSAIDFIISGHNENISRPSYLFENGSSYRENAYTKPGLMLTELKYMLGDSLYYSAMKHYYNKWKLKHVNEERFIDAIEEHVGEELDWFFDPWLHTTKTLDLEITSFKRSLNDQGKWNVTLGIKNNSSRFMPALIETRYEDGSTDRRWWDNHLWRFKDTLSYVVEKKPTHVVLDPDVQTVDLDYRNNSTKMKKRILFDWPGSYYEPRDEMVYKWKPYFYYNSDASDFAPGLNLNWDYGPYESTTARGNYALSSKDIYWYVSGWRQPVHLFPRTTFYFWAYDRPGVKEYGGEIEKEWNKVYGRTPTQRFSLGFYIQPQYDWERSSPLGYDPSGKLGVGYAGWETRLGRVSFNLSGASSLVNYSDWDFTRLTGTATYARSKNMINFKQRMIMGKIWTDNGVPGQEGYNIEGNSSNDMVRKNYLVDQFYGFDSLFINYHMPGEGNIRGFTGSGERGAEALVGFSSEISISKTIPFLELWSELALFADGGIFWDKDRSNNNIDFEYNRRSLADAGVGLRLKRKVFEKNFYLRVDLPFFIYKDNSSNINKGNWIFSFQRSL